MRKIITISFAFMTLLYCSAFAQDRTITGKVTSSQDGSTLPGVSVLVKGTSIGTSTNMDGMYQLKVSPTAKILIFKQVGMKTKEVLIETSDVVNVTTDADVMNLDEVVVTALGIEKDKKTLGYSSQSVKGAELAQSREVNVINALSSKVAGAQVTNSAGTPGASSKIILRGNKSFTGENQPLFVIDGIPMDNSTSATSPKDNPFNPTLEQVNYSNRAVDINSDDVESINVLKGPAAAALYGVRASNGAIIITTKKAKYGQKTEVSYSTNLGIDQVNRLPELQMKYAQGTGGGVTGGTPKYQTYLPGPDGIYGTGDDIEGTSQSWGPTNSSLGITPVDNVGKFFQTGYTYSNNLSISSGTDKNSYRLSIGRLDQTGIIPNTDFKRTSVRLTAQSLLSSKFSVTSTVDYTNSGGHKAQQGSNLSGVMLGLTRAPSSYDLSAGEENPSGTQRTYLSFYDNPYWSAKNNSFIDNTDRIIASFALNYSPYNWLQVIFRPGTDFYTDKRKSIFAIGANNSAGTVNGQITENTIFHQQLYSDLLATATHSFAKKIVGTLTVGNNFTQNEDQNQLARGRNLAIPQFYNLSNASERYADQTSVRTRSAALFFDGNISYNNLVYLGFTGRQEWSSTLGINKRSFFFPSTNLSFVFSEMDWFKQHSDILSFGKLRLAAATGANVPRAYSSINTYNVPFFTDGYTDGYSFPYRGQSGYGQSNVIANPDLKPERTTSYEIGTELKFLKGRVFADITLYKQNTVDILLFRPVPFSTGHAAFLDNGGEMENKGIEILAGGTPVKFKDFEWEISLNFAKNVNTVTKLAEGLEQIEIEAGFGDPGVFAKVGQPYGSLFGTTWNRDANGALIIGANGLPTKSATTSYLGNAYPDYLLGIRNTFNFKGIFLSGLIDIKKGGVIWNGSTARLNRLGRSIATEDREKTYIIEGVKADGSPNTTPVSAFNYWQRYKGDLGATEEAVQDASWIRLREITVGYNFKAPKSFGFIRSIDFSFTGRNLWISTKYTGIDPENSLTGAGSNIGGFDWFNMPNTKSYNFGVKFNM